MPDEQPVSAGVVGLGLMGTSIATCLLAAGHRVVAIDKDATRRRNLKRRVSALLRDMRREKLSAKDPASVMKNLSTSDDFGALRDCGLVIESIFENLNEKRDVLRKIEDAVPPETLIGSNTSALPVTELQRGARHPERILGIHWGEPAHILRFLEVICGAETDQRNAEKVMRLASRWRKEPTLVRRDVRGFITNRIMYAKLLHDFANGIFCGNSDWGWPTAKAYLDRAEQSPSTAVFSLLGHGTLRIARVENHLGPLSERDLDWMEHKLSESIEQGACGFSTGLMYSPGASAPFGELERLCRVVARHGKTYATHMRDYGDHLAEAVDEQLQLARKTGCRLQISHLQAVGPRNWDKQQAALDKIATAAADGIDVGFDCYPYTRGSTVLTQLLPQWALEGGIDGLLTRLGDRAERTRISAETEESLAQGWGGIWISSVESQRNRALLGKTVEAIAKDRAREPVEVVIDLIQEERGRVNMLEQNQSESNLRQTLSHPLSCIISDGFYVQGRPHPRLYGTFPLVLGEMSRERGWLTLAEAVHKITDKPARRFRIAKRGRLEKGYFADVVVFDPETSPATYENPTLAPTAIRHIFRNGSEVI